MTDLVQQFWLRCDDAEPVFSADEIQWTPPQQFDLLHGQGLLKETARATWAICNACGDGHMEEVVWIGRAAPPDVWPRSSRARRWAAHQSSLERLRRWAIDLDLTAQMIRETIGLVGSFSPLVPGRVWGLGRRHLAGRFRDFFLVCGATRADAHTLWARSRHIEDAPSPVILVPAWAPQQRSEPVFRLADIAAITGAGLTLDLDYIADAVPRNSYSAPAKSVANFPVGEDARWEELRITVGERSIVARASGPAQGVWLG